MQLYDLLVSVSDNVQSMTNYVKLHSDLLFFLLGNAADENFLN